MLNSSAFNRNAINTAATTLLVLAAASFSAEATVTAVPTHQQAVTSTLSASATLPAFTGLRTRLVQFDLTAGALFTANSATFRFAIGDWSGGADLAVTGSNTRYLAGTWDAGVSYTAAPSQQHDVVSAMSATAVWTAADIIRFKLPTADWDAVGTININAGLNSASGGTWSAGQIAALTGYRIRYTELDVANGTGSMQLTAIKVKMATGVYSASASFTGSLSQQHSIISTLTAGSSWNGTAFRMRLAMDDMVSIGTMVLNASLKSSVSISMSASGSTDFIGFRTRYGNGVYSATAVYNITASQQHTGLWAPAAGLEWNGTGYRIRPLSSDLTASGSMNTVPILIGALAADLSAGATTAISGMRVRYGDLSITATGSWNAIIFKTRFGSFDIAGSAAIDSLAFRIRKSVADWDTGATFYGALSQQHAIASTPSASMTWNAFAFRTKFAMDDMVSTGTLAMDPTLTSALFANFSAGVTADFLGYRIRYGLLPFVTGDALMQALAYRTRPLAGTLDATATMVSVLSQQHAGSSTIDASAAWDGTIIRIKMATSNVSATAVMASTSWLTSAISANINATANMESAGYRIRYGLLEVSGTAELTVFATRILYGGFDLDALASTLIGATIVSLAPAPDERTYIISGSLRQYYLSHGQRQFVLYGTTRNFKISDNERQFVTSAERRQYEIAAHQRQFEVS